MTKHSNPPELNDIANAFMLEVYEEFLRTGRPLRGHEILKRVPMDLNSNYKAMAIEHFERGSFLEFEPSGERNYFDSTTYTINRDGILEIQNLMSHYKSARQKVIQSEASKATSQNEDSGGTVLGSLEIGAVGTVSPPLDTTSDEYWSPLPVDRTLGGYQEMIGQLNRAKEEIRKDNGYATKHPEERNEILKNLEDGIEMLDTSESVTRQFIETKLLSGLRRIAKIFNKAALEEVAKLAIQAVKAFFFGA